MQPVTSSILIRRFWVVVFVCSVVPLTTMSGSIPLPVQNQPSTPPPITKERLLEGLKQGKRDKNKADLFVGRIKKNGVSFELTRQIEQEIRKEGAYLGSDGVAEIIKAIRESNAQKLADEALKRLQDGKCEEAEGKIRAALNLAPANINFQRVSAEALFCSKRYAEAAAGFVAVVDANQGNASDYNLLGRCYLAMEKYAAAEDAHRQAVRRDRRDAGYYADLGTALEKQKKYEEAEAAFSAALERDPQKAEYRHRLGQAQFNQKKYDLAVASYQEAIKLMPEVEGYRLDLAAALFEQGNQAFEQKQYAEAEVAYQKAAECSPGNAVYKDRLAKSLVAYGKILYSNPQSGVGGKSVAIEKLKKAVSLDLNNDLYHFELGKMLFLERRYQEAATELEMVAKKDVTKAGYQYYWGLSLERQYKNVEAEAAYKKAAELDPKIAEYPFRLGFLLYRLDRNEDAEIQLLKALELNPKNIEYHKSLGLVFNRQEKHLEAEKTFKKALGLAEELKKDLESNDLELDIALCSQYLGDALMKQDKNNAAMAEYKRAEIAIRRLKGQGRANYHHLLGVILTKLDKDQEAKREFTEATRLEEGNALYHHSLGEFLRKKGNFEEAARELRVAVNLAPYDAEYRSHLGAVLGRLKAFKEAEADLREAVRLRPNNAEFNFELGRFLLDGKRGKDIDGCAFIRKAVTLDQKNIDYGTYLKRCPSTTR